MNGMRRHIWAKWLTLFSLLLLALLAACGGGSGNTPDPVTFAITAQPSSQSAVGGAGASFTVSATGSALGYQWQRSLDGGANWVDVAGATIATLTLPVVDVTMNGQQFRARITDGTSTATSTAVTLTVTAAVAPVAISVQPVALTATAGAAAVFNVTATGTSPGYQWQTSPDGSTWTDVAGATQASLNLATVSLADNGKRYRVVVTNSVGSVSSQAALLTVNPAPAAPQIGTQPQVIAVTAPQAASFSVAATGTPAPGYQWQRSTDGGSTWADITGATAASHTTGATSLGDDGTLYRVRVYNSAGDVFSAAVVLAVGPIPVAPAFTVQPASQSVTRPATATFSASASGTPTPTYQWQISTDGGNTFAAIVGATSTSYTTPATTAADSGRQYRVMAINSVAATASNAATLSVTDSPASFAAHTGRLALGRAMHTATLLRDGKVLITGGVTGRASPPSPVVNSAEIFDPATGNSVLLANTMRSPRGQHQATLLPDGKVLITGGQVDDLDGDGSNTAELYDPSNQTFTALTATMTSLRGAHGATLLADGKVLLSGGFGNNPGIDTAELFDPATGRFTALTARLNGLRDSHSATLLPNGKVLLAAGLAGSVLVDTAELYDPVAQNFTPLASHLQSVRGLHAATLLRDGRVMISGGVTAFSPASVVLLDTAEFFDPASGNFSTVPATMTARRAGHAQVLLADGTVLLIGGGTTPVAGPSAAMDTVSTMEIFRP